MSPAQRTPRTLVQRRAAERMLRIQSVAPSRALPWPRSQTLLGRDQGDLKFPDPVEFRHTRTEVDAREIGHLCELAYIAGRTDKHPANGYIQAQIDSAPEVQTENFEGFGTPRRVPSRRELMKTERIPDTRAVSSVGRAADF